MKKKVIVLNLGGSLIIPGEIDLNFLQKFRKVILRNSRKYKFIIVCGGGSIARKYIAALRKAGINEKFQSFSGISATRMNARFMNYLFGISSEFGIPHPLEHKDARLILRISWLEFCRMANKNKYQPGQHFVLDQTAAGIIMKARIPTYILGKDLKQLEKVLHGKDFKGTLIQG